MIHSHGTVVVVVLVVVDVSGLVDVDEDPVLALGADAEPPLVGPVVVVVVDDPDEVPAACAYVIAGATARNSASSSRLSRKIGRM